MLVPALLDWPYARLDPELRKSFEVALHVGTAAALLVALRGEVAEAVRELDAARVGRHALTLAPAAVAAALFERPIERRLGRPEVVAVAQIAAGLALAVADRGRAMRDRRDAGAVDALAIGVGQACALVPGVSRNGATLTAARLRGFDRPGASLLSRHAALPVIAAATLLKGARLARRGLPGDLARAFAVGAGASFASTLAASRLAVRMDRARSYAPLAAYRAALGALALARLRAP